MASFKGNKRWEKGSEWREKARARQRILAMESLENRRLLSGSTPTTGPTWQATDANIYDTQKGPLANEGATLINIYKEYQAYLSGGSQGTFKPTESSLIYFQGNSVEVDARGYGNASTFVSTLQGLGMTVLHTLAQANDTEVEGYMPISALVAASGVKLNASGGIDLINGTSKDPQLIGMLPTYKPAVSYIGLADNEAQHALGADVAAQAFGVNGTGVTVGVLSDSVNQYANGLADSVKTGDIPAGTGLGGSAVNVLQDGPAGSTDEGRRDAREHLRHRAGREHRVRDGRRRRPRLRGEHPGPRHAGALRRSSPTTSPTSTSRSSRTARSLRPCIRSSTAAWSTPRPPAMPRTRATRPRSWG